MALIQPSLDYTDKDFDALRARVRNLISAAFPSWTDDNVANFGNMLVDAWCFVGDVLGKYQDSQARETRWTQATSYKNILALCKLIGFTPSGATAAQATEFFTLATEAVAAVTLPKGTQVFTRDIANPIAYQLLEDLVIPAGATVAEATVENSTFQEDVFDSTGLPNQSFLLARTPYLDMTATVQAGNGLYTQVPNFLNSTPSSLHYTAQTDSQGRARITFGNGILGAVPSGAITVDYKTGGGSAGRVDSGQLSSLPGQFTDAQGNTVAITVTNPVASSTAQDRQSVAQIQVLAPLSVRVSDRTIAREDYEIVALSVAGVSRALMLTSNEDPAVQENTGTLFIVPPGSTVAPQSLLDAVAAAFVAMPYGNTFNLRILPASYLVVNIQVIAYKARGVTPATLKKNILATLGTFFSDRTPAGKPNPQIDFGFYRKDVNGDPQPSLAFSDLFTAVKETAGVTKIDAGPTGFLLNGVRADLAIERRQFPKLGVVTVIDGDTGTQL